MEMVAEYRRHAREAREVALHLSRIDERQRLNEEAVRFEFLADERAAGLVQPRVRPAGQDGAVILGLKAVCALLYR
jgi:hypothetical protein